MAAPKKIYVIGHRNPDTDSIAAAFALSELRRLSGVENIFPMCSGIPGARAKYIFERFKAPLPPVLNDVFPRLRDVMDTEPQHIVVGSPLLRAIGVLEKLKSSQLPILHANGDFYGMLNLFALLDDLLQLSGNSTGLTGRNVHSSLSLISEVLKTENLSLHHEAKMQNFSVYVAAMNVESFKEYIPREHPDELAIVVGDRVDIHLAAINFGVRVMIVTGAQKVDQVVIDAAQARQVSILKTPYDSATVIRRLKFTTPVEIFATPDEKTWAPRDGLADVQKRLREVPEGIFPVVDEQNKLRGTFRKSDLEEKPLSLILVDHNEFENGIEGIEQVPIIEIVDHHRFGMPPTNLPLKITCDVVGSTSTLVAEMYQQEKFIPTPSIAGVLMGGILTDTMSLRSPTTTDRDFVALKYLEKIAGITGDELSKEIFEVGSLIMQQTVENVLVADKKDFTSGEIKFAVAQVEEVSFEPFYARETALFNAAEKICATEQLTLFCLLITDVVRERSLLLVVGKKNLISDLPFKKINDHLFDAGNIVSRKKQLLPQVLKIIGDA